MHAGSRLYWPDMRKDVRILGLAGTLASGKDTVSHLLAEKYGFLHISTSDMLRAAKRKMFGNTPQALLLRNDPFANNLRATRGPGILVDLALNEYSQRQNKYPGGVVISGIRSIGEIESLHKAGGVLLFVDADPKVRYNRTIKRVRDANEQGTSFEDFMKMEASERPADNADKTIQNLNAAKEMADLHLENNGNDLSVFKEEIKELVAPLLK